MDTHAQFQFCGATSKMWKEISVTQNRLALTHFYSHDPVLCFTYFLFHTLHV